MFVLNKINKSLATFTIKKRDRTQIIKKRNERGKKTTNTTEKQTKITLCCEQLYANKLDNLLRNKQVSRNIQPSKTVLRRNKSLKKIDH